MPPTKQDLTQGLFIARAQKSLYLDVTRISNETITAFSTLCNVQYMINIQCYFKCIVKERDYT